MRAMRDELLSHHRELVHRQSKLLRCAERLSKCFSECSQDKHVRRSEHPRRPVEVRRVGDVPGRPESVETCLAARGIARSPPRARSQFGEAAIGIPLSGTGQLACCMRVSWTATVGPRRRHECRTRSST